MGRYDSERWKHGWQTLFGTHRLVHNDRMIKKSKSQNFKGSPPYCYSITARFTFKVGIIFDREILL